MPDMRRLAQQVEAVHMNVASFNLCRELFELSEWDYHQKLTSTVPICPAYDLGYLLRKLPTSIMRDGLSHPINITYDSASIGWLFKYGKNNGVVRGTSSIGPEDAAARLAINMFKQGILSKQES